MHHFKFQYIYFISSLNARVLYEGHFVQFCWALSDLCGLFSNFFSFPIFANNEGPSLSTHFPILEVIYYAKDSQNFDVHLYLGIGFENRTFVYLFLHYLLTISSFMSRFLVWHGFVKNAQMLMKFRACNW